jgi:hypothetical protein
MSIDARYAVIIPISLLGAILPHISYPPIAYSSSLRKWLPLFRSDHPTMLHIHFLPY